MARIMREAVPLCIRHPEGRTTDRTLTKWIVDRLAVDDKDAVFWDRELPGFGLRVYPSGAKVYVVQTRCAGRSKRATVGRHGDVSPDQARKDGDMTTQRRRV